MPFPECFRSSLLSSTYAQIDPHRHSPQPQRSGQENDDVSIPEEGGTTHHPRGVLGRVSCIALFAFSKRDVCVDKTTHAQVAAF